MKIAYICSPFRGERDGNKKYARELTKFAIELGYAPITTHLYITECLDDNLPEERVAGIAAGLALIRAADIIIVGSKYGISDGMYAEIDKAKEYGVPIIERND